MRSYAVPCLKCGVSTYFGPRCRRHARPDPPRRSKTPTRTGYTHAEKKRRKQAVREHVARHGWVCPGWQRTAHRAYDLTADHVVPVAAGGSQGGPLQVLCRSCNGRKGASRG